MPSLLHASRLAAVHDRIDRACDRAGRARDSVRLLAVTKTRPDTDLEAVYSLGLRTFGENRVAEARAKQTRLPSDIEWHFIGHLQTNKAKDCLGFSWVHSVDRWEAAQALEKVFAKAGKTLNILLEVNTGNEPAKAGVRSWSDLMQLAERVAALPHLRLRGLMTMAPFSSDEAVVRPCFVRLREWRDRAAERMPEQDWTTLSMGMTNDLDWAIEEGSTMVRIGTAIFEGFR